MKFEIQYPDMSVDVTMLLMYNSLSAWLWTTKIMHNASIFYVYFICIWYMLMVGINIYV